MMEPQDDLFSTARPAGCLSRFQLERFLAGELAGEAYARIDGHLEACAGCRALRAKLEAEKAHFQREVPFEAFLAGLERRLEEPAREEEAGGTRRLEAEKAARTAAPRIESGAADPWYAGVLRGLEALWRFLLTPAGAGVAVAALAMVVVLPRLLEPEPAGYTGFRSGEIEPGELTVYALRRGSEVATRPSSGEVFYAGDRLQFEVHPGSRRYLQLVSVDATGRLSPFYPEDGGQSIHLGQDARILLPGSILLDDYVGLERVFAVYSASPLRRQALEAGVAALVRRHGTPLPLDRLEALPLEDTAQASFLLVKR